jgi:CBS domain-containing protein/ribosome-associated translation inhibitor RaiA
MNIADIATRDYVAVDIEERLSKVRSRFERENPKGFLVTEDDEYAGVINERQLVQSHVQDSAKVRGLVQPAPKVGRQDDIREVARVLVEGGARTVPVFENNSLWGVVTADDILGGVLPNLDALDVSDIYTEQVVTVSEQTNVGRVINLLREHGVSRLPVLSPEDRLTGIVTTHDIADFAVRDMERQQKGDRSGDRDRVLDIPVYDIMSSPVETITLDASVQTAVERMLDNDFSGLVITPPEEQTVDGILTKTDVLRALTYTEEEHMDVQVTNVHLLDSLTRDQIQQRIETVADKYQKMQVHHAHVRLKEHKERIRGTPLMQCGIRLRTNKGQVGASGEGYGARNAFGVALDTLERRVLELKGVQADEEYRGQLLRKLNEL